MAPASRLSYFSTVPQGSGRGKDRPPTDMDWFVYSAKNYRFKGKQVPIQVLKIKRDLRSYFARNSGASLGELCDANALVCDQLERRNVALAWRNLRVFYDEIDVQRLFNCLPPELQREHVDLLSSGGATRTRHHSVRASSKRNPSGGVGGGAGGGGAVGQAGEREPDRGGPLAQHKPELDDEDGSDVDEGEFPENELTLTSGNLLNKLSPGEKASSEGAAAKSERRKQGGGQQGGDENPADCIGLFVHEGGGQKSLLVEDTEQDNNDDNNHRS